MKKILLIILIISVTNSCDDYTPIRFIETNYSEESSEPNLHRSNSGEIYLSFISFNLETNESQLLYSLLNYSKFSWNDFNFITKSSEMFVNWADFPKITTNSSNGVSAHYLEMTSDEKYSYDIKILNSKNGGITWNKPIKIHNDNTKTEHGFVSTINIKDHFLSTYLDGRQYELSNHNSSIKAQMTLRGTSYNIEGQIIDDKLIDDRVCDCCQTDLGITDLEIPIVVYRDRSEDETRDIYYSYLDINNTWSKPATVYNDNWIISGCPVNGPAISTFNNKSAVVWYTYTNNKSLIKIAFSNDIAEGFNTPIEVNADNPIGRVDIELIDGETALISYMDNIDGNTFVKLHMVNRSGNQNKFLLVDESSKERSSGFPKIVLDKKRNLTIIAWTEVSKKSKIKTALIDNSFFYD